MAPTDPAAGDHADGAAALGRLLAAGRDSVLAPVLRGWLVGLDAALGDAAANAPGDPGAGDCREVRAWLAGLLPGSTLPGSTLPRSARPWPAPRALAGFLGRLTKEPQVTGHLDAATVRAWQAFATALDAPWPEAQANMAPPAGLWETIQLRLLRLPEPAARQIRDDLWRSAGHPPAASSWRDLASAGGSGEALVAPLDGAGPGVRASSDPEPDEEVLACLSRCEAAELAQVCSALLTAAEIDDDLWLCLESLQFGSAVRLDDAGRRRLRREVIGRLSEYARHRPYSDASVQALVAVDEAVHGVVHLPVAASGSWWERLWRRSSDIVERQAEKARAGGADIEVRPLILDYPDVRHLTRNDLAVGIGGEPGDVLACLRLYASIGGQKLPGRVMYRASR
jgi:hypothetical protein